MSEPVMLPSIEGMGAKLGEGMGANHFWPTDFQPIDVAPKSVVAHFLTRLMHNN